MARLSADRIVVAAILGAIAVFITACSGSTGTAPPPPYNHGEGIPASSGAITRWAGGLGPGGYEPGTDPPITAGFDDPAEAFGAATTASTDVVCLGRGGRITLDLETPIADGAGADLAVYENGIAGDGTVFAELAFVEVSSDGSLWTRFRTTTQNTEPVGAYAQIDPSLYRGFAGVHPAGTGTAFDLAELADTTEVVGGSVTLDSIRYVRITDVVGDGSTLADDGNPIYDPYPTEGTAGFDLDGVAVLR